MPNLRCLVALLLGLLPLAVKPALAQIAASDVKNSLSVTIKLDPAADPPQIDVDKPFQVVLKNNSDRPLHIWNPYTKNGYCQLSFRFTNSHSGQLYVAHKRQIEDQSFWQTREEENEPGSHLIEILPKDDVAIPVLFSDFDWADRDWAGLPNPNSRDRFSVSAQFESAVIPGDATPSVWTGSVLSDPVVVDFIAPKLKTPGDYLWNGFPAAAIELMKSDPKLIASRDENQCTPLHHAARLGYLDGVNWLLDNGTDVNAIAYNGFTPLHLTDDPRVVELILEKKPDLSIRDRIVGQTLLQRAAANLVDERRLSERNKWRQIVDMFLNAGAEYDILTAIDLNDIERVKAILKKTPKYASRFQDESPLRTAASLGRLEICRYLIKEHHVDVDDFKGGVGYPIIKSTLAYPEVVRLLIDSGADF